MAAVTWGNFKQVVRRSILKDPAGAKWDDDKLRDYVGWALDALLPHTAYATGTSFVGDGATTLFTLPDNVYLPIELAGLVSIQSPTTEYLPKYLKPVFSSWDISPDDENGFREWPQGKIKTNVPVNSGDYLVVEYYAYFNHPVLDADVLTCPVWALAAISYRMGAYALGIREIGEAGISTYDDKRDSGNPEDNATRYQAESWIKRWYEELAAHPKQVRKQSPHDRR